MIYREKQVSEPKKYAQSVFVDLPILLSGKEKLYYNRNFGYVITEQVYTEFSQLLKPSPGGILADEMGLGKTVETLALTVHNKKEPTPQNFSFFNRTGLFALTEDPLQGKNSWCLGFYYFITTYQHCAQLFRFRIFAVLMWCKKHSSGRARVSRSND